MSDIDDTVRNWLEEREREEEINIENAQTKVFEASALLNKAQKELAEARKARNGISNLLESI